MARDAARCGTRSATCSRQRIFGLACGYEDANDADALADDPMHKLLLGRDPVDGARLGLAADALAV